MSRRHPDEVYEDDSFYEEVDHRRRSRDDRYPEPELGPRRRQVPRSPPRFREIDEQVRWRERERERDRSAPDFRRERFLPTRDEDDLPPRRRDRVHADDLRLERETEEVYLRRETPSARTRPKRASREEIVLDEVGDHGSRPREKEKVTFEERRTSSPRRHRPSSREDVERDEYVYLRRDQSLPPRRPRRSRDNEDIFIEKERKRYESSESEAIDDEEAIIRRDHGHRRRRRPSSREDDVEREKIEIRRRSLPPLDSHRERGTGEEDDELVIRHRERSSNRRRRPRFLPEGEEEEEREEEIIFEDRDRSPHRRAKREEFVVRHEDRSPRRHGRDDELDDVVIRRRSRSIPDREDGRDEVIIRHKSRPSPRREDDREEVIIRHRDHSAPEREDDGEEFRFHRRHRPSRARDEEEDDTMLRRRSAHSLDKEREEVIIRKDKHGRRLSLGTNVEEDELIIRDEGRERDDGIEFRHGQGLARSHSRHKAEAEEEIIIRHDDREGPRGRKDGSREIIIRKDEKRESSESSSEPPVIRKPPILQEVITHHRHIDSYETIPPRKQDYEKRSLADDSEEIEIKQRKEKDGLSYAEEIIVDRQSKDRGLSPPHRRHSRPEEEEEEEDEKKETVITRTISGDHGRERETIILEREPKEHREREIAPREEPAIGRRYTGTREKREKLWTEIAKDLVIREALERVGYEFEESENSFYVFEYLRYEDVERLVNISDDIRHFRRERIRGIRREREMLPRLPVIPGPPHSAPRSLPPRPPPLLERPPAREPYPWEGRERFRERDVIIEEDRRSRPRLYREI